MKLVVALDLPSPENNLDLVRQLTQDQSTIDVVFKVGLNTFIAGGPKFIEDLKKVATRHEGVMPNPEICLDLKLYDIPNTMRTAAERIYDLGVDMVTIHGSVGEQGIKAVVSTYKDRPDAPKVLATTILTSFTHDHCLQIYSDGREETAKRIAEVAILAGVDGIVCSADDLERVRAIQNSKKPRPSCIKFVSGIEIRPRNDDHQRKGTLKDVIQGGADYCVVGRQIHQDTNPVAVTMRILEKIRKMEDAWETFNNSVCWDDT